MKTKQRYRRFMQENLFDHISIKPENTIVPDGLADDIPSMCRAYERKIEDWGGVDIQLLGIGHDGHIGFNEPCDHFPVMTHEVQLTDMTREANTRFFNSIDEVPTAAITMGVGTVMAARKIVMVITGADKADILYKVFFGPPRRFRALFYSSIPRSPSSATRRRQPKCRKKGSNAAFRH